MFSVFDSHLNANNAFTNEFHAKQPLKFRGENEWKFSFSSIVDDWNKIAEK